MPLDQTLHVELNTLAKRLAQFGRGKDALLAHITPKEAQLLKERGGRGSTNPVTGLLEFDTPDIENVTVTAPAPQFAPDIQAPPPPPPQQPEKVTVTANAAPTSATVPDTGAPITPLATPQLAQTAAPAAPAQVAPEQVTVAAPAAQPNVGIPTAPPVPTARPDDQTDQQPSNQPGFLERNKTLLEALGIGGLGLYGGMNNARAAGQAQQLQQNLAGLAAPLSAQGNAALAGVQTGALTPANERALEAVRAQTAQGQQSGAVSSQQAAEAVSTTFANLLNNQLNQALALLNTADSYLQNAYTQGYQANINNQTNTQNFYQNLAQLAARLGGMSGGTSG